MGRKVPVLQKDWIPAEIPSKYLDQLYLLTWIDWGKVDFTGEVLV